MKKKNFKIQIAGHSVSVEWKKGLIEDYDAAGDWSFHDYAVRLDDELGETDAQVYLIHECTHAVSDVYGLGLEENQVRILAEGLQQMLAKFLKDIRK